MAGAWPKQHDGRDSSRLETLTELAGVGRKTANVVLGTAYGIASGVVVDTHVKRLAYRLGLTTNKLPEPIERDLMAVVPRSRMGRPQPPADPARPADLPRPQAPV